VNYDDRARRVHLIHGEAWFDVSKRPTWPFIVSVDGQEIRALGTSFIVRADDTQGLSVTLVEGRVSVAPIAGHDEASPQAAQILTPGQRLLIARNHAPALDRPELTRITAWERGRVEFEETPLGDAAKEMNRYSKTHIAITDAEIAQLRIGGVFRAGDSDEFVRIVTAAFGLQAERSGNSVVLARRAAPSPVPAGR
jgi:transmembrane sensor